ncbi:MAG: restriction endonuclease subunit S [Actinomycetes bacterium]
MCNKDAVLLCVRGSTTGRTNRADQSYALGRGVAAIETSDPTDQSFAYFALLSSMPSLLERTTGSVFPNLSRDDIASVALHWPDRDSRRAIAEVLGALDDKIETNRKLSKLLEGHLASLFSEAKFDDADDRAVRLTELIDVNPARPKPTSHDAQYIDMSSLPTDAALVAAPAYRFPKSGTRFVNGDTVMARITPCLENGKVAYIDCLPTGCTGVGSTEFIVLRPKDPVPTQFAYFLARSQRFTNSAVRHMSGSSGRQRCPAEAVTSYAINWPDHHALARFVSHTEPSFASMRAALNESLVLMKLRDTLLPKLLSGEMRVTDAEQLASDVSSNYLR